MKNFDLRKYLAEGRLLNEAVSSQSIVSYYNAVCQAEGIKPLPLKFTSVKFGGASTSYNTKTNKALYISFDVSKMMDPEFAILHELTHQIKLETENDPYLGKKDQSSKFQKLQSKLMDKYMYSEYSSLLYKK